MVYAPVHSASICWAISQTIAITGSGVAVGVGTSVGIVVGSRGGVGEVSAVGGRSVGITAVDSTVTGTVPLQAVSSPVKTSANRVKISLRFISISPLPLGGYSLGYSYRITEKTGKIKFKFRKIYSSTRIVCRNSHPRLISPQACLLQNT